MTRAKWDELVKDIQHPDDPSLVDGADIAAILWADRVVKAVAAYRLTHDSAKRRGRIADPGECQCPHCTTFRIALEGK